MGKIIADAKDNGEYEDFVKNLQQMYNGSRKWGSVRVSYKRGELATLILSFSLPWVSQV